MTRPILVTGSHRAGTTWVGSMLCASAEAGKVHEPFNLDNPVTWLRRRPNHWWLYICADNEAEWRAQVEPLMRLRFPARARLREIDSRRVLRAWGREARRSAAYRARRTRLLVKDPLAFFSTPWLAGRFGVQPVIMVRHPAGFASSLRSLGWRFDFRNWLDQPLLMRDHLEPFRTEIADFAARERPPVEQAALMWKVIYGVAAELRDRHPDWLFVRYEDLARDPLAGFEQLYGKLGLRFVGEAARAVAEHSARDGGAGPPTKHEIRRDSAAAARSWTTRLDAADLDLIRSRVGATASSFYDDDTWQLPVGAR